MVRLSNDSEDTGEGLGSDNGVSQDTIPPDCAASLKAGGLLDKVVALLPVGPYYDIDKIQDQPASAFFGKKGTKGLTAGQYFDKRGSDAVTHVHSGKPGVYSRGGEAGLQNLLKLHEISHLADNGYGNLDNALARRLRIKINKGQSASDAVSNYFNSGCDPTLLLPPPRKKSRRRR